MEPATSGLAGKARELLLFHIRLTTATLSPSLLAFFQVLVDSVAATSCAVVAPFTAWDRKDATTLIGHPVLQPTGVLGEALALAQTLFATDNTVTATHPLGTTTQILDTAGR